MKRTCPLTPQRSGNARFRALCEALERRIVFNTTNPAIFNVTESVAAGQVISVQGDNFGTNPQLWLDRITDSSDTPDAETQITNVLTSNNQLITAELPTTLQEGLYAVMVKNTQTGITGAYKFVNQARGLSFLDLGAPEVLPSQAFRIAGRNLDFAGATTTVTFHNTSQPTLPDLSATVTQGTDPYVLRVISPAGLVAGNVYQVIVNNGYGGAYGNATVSTTLTAKAAGVDHWNTGTTWAVYELNFYNNVIDVGSFGAIANDGIDDTAAIQAAINYASTSVVNGITGGVVQFGAGQFDVNGTTSVASASAIAMKGRVVLQGAGMNATRIYADVGGPGSLFGGNVARVGAVDLTIEAGPNANNNTWAVGGSSSWAQLLLRTRFINYKAHVLDKGSMKELIDGCELLQLTSSGAAVMDYQNRDDLIVRNSFIRWGDGRVPLFTSSDFSAGPILLENNTWSRSVYSDGNGSGTGYGGPSLGRAKNVIILNNVFNKYDDPNDPNDQNLNIPTSNDGETLLNEDIDYDGFGTVVSSTDTTVTFSANYTSSKVGKEVTIIDGKGMGQTRKIVSGSGTTWTLDSAWDVNPDTTSSYAINSFDDNYLIKDNTLQDVPRGIWVTYGSAMRDVAIVNNQLLDANTIYLRGDSRSGGRFNVQKNIVIDGNYLENSYNKDPAQIVITQGGDSSVGYNPGVAFYNVDVRNNTIKISGSAAAAGGFRSADDGTGMAGDGYFVRGVGVTDNDTPSVYGVVLDHNKSVNLPTAYSVNTGSYYTVIFNSANENVGTILSDTTSSGGTHASVGTVQAYTSAATPPFVFVTATTGTTTEGNSTPANIRFSRTGTSGNLVVNYSITSGTTASASDYAPTLTGSVTIANGQSYVDLPITAVDDLVYFEPNKTLKLTLTANAAYQVATPWAQVVIVDNDVTNKILDVGFSGTGGGTGGASDLMTAGGTATLVQGSGGTNSISVGNANPMGGGNYATLNFVTSDTAPSARITPFSAANSWAAMTTKPGSQWLINGGFDFFVRRISSSGSIRIMDLGTAGSNSWEVILQLSGTGLRMKIDAPGTNDFDQTIGSMGLNTIYHLGVTMATDAGTGLVTVKFFRKAGTGAIDTSAATDLVGTYTFNPDDAATNGFTSGAFNLGTVAAFGTNNVFDLDTFRMYKADPVVFSDISGESMVTVAATDSTAAETAGDTGTFTFTRSNNNTLKDLVVHYTLSGTAGSGDYTVAPTLGTVTILAGQTSATVTVSPIDDTTYEGMETVVANVTPDPMYVVSSTGASIAIADNDVAGIPLTSVDIGATGLAGSDTMDPLTGRHTQKGAGLGFSGKSDTFNFAYTKMTGDGSIIARFASISAGSVWARTGLMMRDSLAAGSKFAFAGVSKAHGAYWTRRTSDNTTASSTNTTGITAPYWFKLTRVGNVFTAYRSADGLTWTRMGSTTIVMGPTIYVGLATMSNSLSSLATAVVDTLKIL